MPSLKEIRTANASLAPSTTLTAVFIGGTSGLGHATLRAFITHIAHPTALILGRSQSRFEPQLLALRTLNPDADLTFIEHPIELLRDVDAASALIATHLAGRKIDLLYQSQGFISFAGRQDNADGLDSSIALRYYGRVRFTRNLLPYLSPAARVVSVLAGTREGRVFEDDWDLERSYSIPNTMGHFASMMTLSYDALAGEPGSEGRVFVHAFPGLASTGLLGRSATGVLGVLFRWVVDPVLGVLVAARPEDVGERLLWYGTDVGFAAEKERRGGKAVAVDETGVVRENEVLRGYRERGLEGKVAEWEGEVFERATATAAAAATA